MLAKICIKVCYKDTIVSEELCELTSPVLVSSQSSNLLFSLFTTNFFASPHDYLICLCSSPLTENHPYTTGIRQYQWYYEPTTTGGMGAIEIDVYFSLPKPDVHKAMEMYTSSKQEALESKPWRQEGKEVDGWVDWPKRYPNRNEYETMEACGMIKSGKKVAWVQGGYFVELSGGPLMEEGGLEEYADGVWLVVNGAGEEVEGLKKDDDEEEEEE